MKKNKVTPLPLSSVVHVRKNEDIYYEYMMWVIYVLLCCVCLCIGFILVLYLVIEKDIEKDNV